MPTFVIFRGIRTDTALKELTVTTTTVHLAHRPFGWVIDLILARCPKLRRLEIPPGAIKRLPSLHRSRLEERGIRIVTGKLARHDHKPRGQKFRARQHFLTNLTGDTLARLERLLAIDHPATKALLHHYGARGFAERQNTDMYREFGQSHPAALSDNINGVLYFLDPTHKTGQRARDIARVLPKKIARNEARQKQVHQNS
jgi:hypothetical protein